jgi:SNF2 family DNA or RNA helicase
MMRDFIMAHNRCNIWASPGTGKTAATYTAFDLLKLLGSRFFPVLVIAPKRVAQTVWPREQQKWRQFRDLKVVCLAGIQNPKLRAEMLRRKADIYTINYDQIQWLTNQFPEGQWPFKAVVADESTKLKNFRLRKGGKRATALARIQKHVGRWINLTGTPSPNGLLDLWGQMWFLDRGERLGRTFGEYKKTYFDENLYTGEVTPRKGAAEQIAAKIADITLSIQARDYFDLPPIIENTIECNLGPDAQNAYDSAERQMYLELGDKIVDILTAAAATTKCLQIASGFVYTDKAGNYEELDDVKIEALKDLIEDANGSPVLVAYHWRVDKARLEREVGARTLTSASDIDDWNAGRIRVGLVNPQSIGHGVDLAIGGNILVFYSNWWTLEDYLQVIERIGPTRQAQHRLNRPVWIHHLVSVGTLDEGVMERHHGKRSVQDILLARTKR